MAKRRAVHLDDDEYQAACGKAIARIVGIRQHETHDTPHWDANIRGALGEMAFAKWLHPDWDAARLAALLLVNTFRDAGDVHGVEVRCTRHRDGHLLLRPDDAADRDFVLVVGEGSAYEVIGYWPAGRKPPRECFFAERGKAKATYWLPQAILEDPSKLRRRLRKELKRCSKPTR